MEPIPISTGIQIREREAFENGYYFIKALEILALDAPTQCETMGNYNVAWELKTMYRAALTCSTIQAVLVSRLSNGKEYLSSWTGCKVFPLLNFLPAQTPEITWSR